MSTPQQQAPKAPRRSGRKNKGNNTPNGAQRVVMSDNEVTLGHEPPSGNEQLGGHNKGRRKSHATNKPHNSGNVSDNPQPIRAQPTPIKAYAGPTFHHSPAASALPLPSFYSRSVPAQPPKPVAEDPAESTGVTPPNESTPTKRESTPLDFLFDAARQARGTPRGQSPAAHSGNCSIPSHSPARGSPAPRETDAVFPFELDGASTPGEDGTPFAPTYRDRMASVNSTRSTSEGIQGMDEFERRAKSDALKKLLMQQSPQKGPQMADPNNPFNARPAQPRQHSGPTPPAHYQNPTGYQNQFFPPMNDMQRHNPMFNGIPARPPSHLRYEAASEPEPAELSSDSALSPPRISTARRHANGTAPHAQNQYGHPYEPHFGQSPGLEHRPSTFNPYGPPPNVAQQAPNNPGHRSKPSAQQLEGDLRRVLNMNVAGN